eukprot:gene272-biopygen3008
MAAKWRQSLAAKSVTAAKRHGGKVAAKLGGKVRHGGKASWRQSGGKAWRHGGKASWRQSGGKENLGRSQAWARPGPGVGTRIEDTKPEIANRSAILAGVVEHLHLGGEGPRLLQGPVLLVDHHVAGARHVVLVQPLDVQADVVPRLRVLAALVVHLAREHLAGARVGGGVGREKDHLLAGLHDALLDTAGDHVPDALDLVHAGHGHPHRRVVLPLRHADHVVQRLLHADTIQTQAPRK